MSCDSYKVLKRRLGTYKHNLCYSSTYNNNNQSEIELGKICYTNNSIKTKITKYLEINLTRNVLMSKTVKFYSRT